jgi:hypothetical protein
MNPLSRRSDAEDAATIVTGRAFVITLDAKLEFQPD